MSNHRSKCPCCKSSVLTRDIGQHILRNHEPILFQEEDNLKALHKDKYLNKPLEIFINDETYHICFADSSCIKKIIMAERHFKGKADKHKERILELRSSYPLGSTASEPTTSSSLFTLKDKKALQTDILSLIVHVRNLEKRLGLDEYQTFTFTKRGLIAFSNIDITADDDTLKECFPDAFPVDKPETKEEEAVVEEEVEEDDILPFVYEKPMTKEEYIRKNFTKKDILNLSTNVATGQIQHVPELEAFKKLLENTSAPPTTIVAPRVSIVKRKPKEVDDSPSTVPAPVPVPVPVVDEFPPLDYTKSVAPWELFIRANSHAKTDHERIAIAREIGFPNHQIPHEVLHPQSAARIVTLSNHSNAAAAPSIPRLVFNTKAPRKPKATDC